MIDALKREIWDECGASVVVEKLFFIGSNTCTYEGYNGVKMVPTKVVFGFICKYAEKMWEEHLYDLADFILKIDGFDERLAKGDPALVNIIAKNTGAINLFSFASKYCTYHNVEIYERDDYSIFDGIVRKTLPQYIKGISSNDSWRISYNYEEFNNCIGEYLDKNNIDYHRLTKIKPKVPISDTVEYCTWYYSEQLFFWQILLFVRKIMHYKY